MREKRRPTLEELESLPDILWHLEVAQIWADATAAGQFEVAEQAEDLCFNPKLTPKMVVELREKLQRATGSTEVEDAA
jgi:hypothetical protein